MLVKILFISYMFFSYSSNWFIELCLLIKFDIIEFQKNHSMLSEHTMNEIR